MGACSALKMMLVDNVFVSVTNEQGKRVCILNESDGGYSVKIRDIPDDALIFSCDRFPNAGEVFFKGKNGECKRADYVLISEKERLAMIFELKRSSSSASGKEIIDQLKGASCILKYCESLASEFLGEHDIFSEFSFKYYKGNFKASKKRAFCEEAQPDNSKPENARVLPGNYANFNRLR